MNDIYSFYQLISKYQIEIPIIQRDYAQGRDNTKAADVRKSLVEKMRIAVEDKDKTLFFDFVYGRVDGNKFIPFDGQQRLTSLFLFHKYVFEKCQFVSDCRHNGNCICKEILKRFSYATRQSSREFCEKLVQESVIPSDEKKVSENIKNQSWFYPDWQKDPTIIGMLTMLDEIHNQMNGKKNFKVVAEKLTSGCNCPITFHFVDMGKHKLSDETYVKMNARGKQLTPFENFKASLEQYLEEKKEQKLLCRLKGKYDESKKKYSGIDGSWLDLFWEITNKDKQENEGKELPDSLMMSFFNRHFMNVWRCWYDNNSKSEKDCEKLSEDEKNKQKEWDYFNNRIQKEMPLYPTKDDFVSFDIYSYIMDKCSTDKCLTPIFNIIDALCVPNNCIEKDCQAVWNRNEEKPQWSLYRGDKNNNNRETYPSRIAFYALMKYIGIGINQTSTESLSQWMRVVWNIIENSTIDSSEPYHAALRLINKLSEKSHTIYKALAFELESFKLGNQYHAKEQVEEEVVKARKIISDSSWEAKIINAEKYAFFKGAIRFLFTNENGGDDWNDFDTKWGNLKEYFDENGVKDNYRTNACLLRYYISKFNEWWMFWNYSYDNKPTTWKSILTSNRFVANHSILIQMPKNLDVMLSNFNAHLDICDDNYKDLQNNVQNDLVKTTILVEASKWSSKLNWHYSTYCLYPHNAKADWKKYVIGNHRNQILSSLCDSKEIVVEGDRRFKSGDCNDFFWGWNISFKYNSSYDFEWNADGNVYLIENNERKKIADGTEYRFSANGIDKVDAFLKKLNELISKSAE